jgi:hypothetical protein
MTAAGYTMLGFYWLVAAIALGILGVCCFFLTREKASDEALPVWALAGILLACSVGLGLSLAAGGWNVGSVWSFRLAPAAIVLAVLVGLIRFEENRKPAVLSAWLVAVLFHSALSIVSWLPGSHPPRALVTSSTVTAVALDPVVSAAPSTTFEVLPFWYNVGVLMLVLGTLAFGYLFFQSLERGSRPRFETHWGGLGGGVGGWQITASMSYLIAALAFGTLFSLFVLRLDEPEIARRLEASLQKLQGERRAETKPVPGASAAASAARPAASAPVASPPPSTAPAAAASTTVPDAPVSATPKPVASIVPSKPVTPPAGSARKAGTAPSSAPSP